ncbi:MAG: energy transducer TonB [Acidobacteriota bacterium]
MRAADKTIEMATNPNSPLSFFKSFLERLLALRITPSERLVYVDDAFNIFATDVSGRKPMRVSAILALLFHILLFVVVFPSFGTTVFQPTQEVFVIKQLARPSKLAGMEGRPEAAPPKPRPVVPKPKPKVVPIPDPTPNAPEPIRKPKIEEIPKVLEELAVDLNIGEVTAPPGPPSRGGVGRGALDGSGVGDNAGVGPGMGDGSGPFRVGGGITNPQVLRQTTPSYTDEAIKSKVQGVVVLEAVIRRNRRADSLKVLRGLGYGLEQSAIQEIATNWRFRPGMKDGRPVDVLATIEVSFNLR